MEIFVVIACVVSAVLGALAITTGYSSPQSTARGVTDVWLVACLVLNGAYTRAYWATRNKPIKEFLASAPYESRLAKVTGFGLLLLIMVRIALFFV